MVWVEHQRIFILSQEALIRLSQESFTACINTANV